MKDHLLFAHIPQALKKVLSPITRGENVKRGSLMASIFRWALVNHFDAPVILDNVV